MNLHNEIMNIPANIILDGPEGVGNVSQNPYIAYKEGHRDARHDAAELSLKYEAYIERLESELRIASDYSGFEVDINELKRELDL